VTVSPEVEDLLRQLAPRVLGLLVRRYGGFDACEDAVQEALIAGARQWPEQGVPDNPYSWLITVASRRLVDARRSEAARTQRETNAVALDEQHVPGPGEDDPTRDDTLLLLLLCCHPALAPSAQMALTLRAVGGLTTTQIARAFLVPDATMGQRISRAKQRIKASGIGFRRPPPEELAARLGVVLHVLYLIFNEGYTATAGADLQQRELTGEAIRLTRDLHRQLPEDGEIAGLLALMLLTEARHAARTGPDGTLIPIAEQDRARWNRDLIAEATALLTRTLQRAPIGPYQLQAAIAAVHNEAARAEDTDWPQILVLYRLLEGLWPTPVVRLNKAIAEAMVHGPRAGLDLLSTVELELAGSHRVDAVRAHLLELAGDRAAALSSYELAARRTTSLPEQHYLRARAARLSGKD
jgi:RNA polymerase sigma factor (sigma-70 family)